MVERQPPVHNEISGTVLGHVVQAGYIESVTIPAQAAATPIDEAIHDPAPVIASVLSSGFTGRGWLLRQVDEFLNRSPCGYVWIEADAGMGKSAFAAHLVREHGWFGHFARFTRGQTVRVGLRNLAAQLIKHYDLWELAPGRMLAESVCTPEGFETVLARAADKARANGRRLVLVVDGADEAESPKGMLPWGLPSFLPEGVFLIGTYRTGNPPGHSDAPRVVVRIDAEDSRNQEDLREHLDHEVREEVLAARLVSAEISAEQFIRQVATRCGGVWVYLRYVLHEIRLGLRRADDVDDLPANLRSYYTSHLEAWLRDEHGQEGSLRLLATLAAACEPLRVATLAILAEVPEEQARRWCQYQSRPFLTATPTTPQRFEIYHASLRELFAEDALPDRLPEDQRAWSETLAHAALAAHNRIAAHYLAAFGGLDADLPALAAEPRLADMDDGYPLRYLASHLQRAGRVDELHRLLRAERPVAPDRALNVWFATHDRADAVDAYLDDIALAREDSRQRTDRALREHRPAAALAEEVHYALVTSSLASLTDNVPHNLLSHLVVHGLWTPQRAIAHARRLTTPEDRARALAALAPLLPHEQRREVLDQAVAAAVEVTSVHDRTRVLTELVKQALPERRQAVVTHAMEAVASIPWAVDRVRALTRLGEHAPPARRSEMLVQALEEVLAERRDRARMLTSLTEHLPAKLAHPVLERALEEAEAVGDAASHALALAGLVEHVPAAYRRAAAEQALTKISAIDWEPDRVRVLTTLAGHVSEDRRQPVLEHALRVAATIVNGTSRTRELAGLVRHVPRERQQAVLQQALESAATPTTTFDRVDALTEVVEHVPAEHRHAVAERVLDIATAITYTKDRVKVLTALLEHLPTHRRHAVAEQVLGAVTTIGHGHMQAWAMIRLAGHVPAERLLTTAEQALDSIATHISYEHTRAGALAELVGHMPDGHRQAVAEQAWHRAAAIESVPERVLAFAKLVHHLAPDLQPTAVDQALSTATGIARDLSRAWALTDLLEHLPDGRRQTVAEQTLDIVATFTDAYDRARVLSRLLEHLPAERRHTLAEQTLAAFTDRRTPALPLVLPAVVDTVLQYTSFAASLRTAEEMAANVTLDIVAQKSRIRTVAALVQHLPDQHRQALAARAIEEANAIDWPADRIRVLSELTGQPPDTRQSEALTWIATSLPGGNTYGARTYGGRDQVEALVKRLETVPPEQRDALAEQALDVATTIPDDYIRSEVLTELAPHLSAELFAQSLVSNPHRRVQALTRWLTKANETITISTAGDYVHLLRDATRSLPRQDYLSVLNSTAPALQRIAGPSAVDAIVKSIVDVGRWWP